MFFVTRVEEFLKYLGKLTFFIRDILKASFYWVIGFRLQGKSLLRDIVFIGLDSAGLVSLISFFVGIIIAFQTAHQLRQIAASGEILIAPLVVLSLTRELGPVLGSLIVAARSGASITAQIGSMKISEQIDALEVMGIDPIDYLVTPKFLSLIISMPLLVIYADFLGVVGGYLVGSLKFAIPMHLYFRMTFDALTYKDVISGLIKSVCFGAIIAFVSCFEGFQPFSSSDVAKVVTQAVVRSFILIIVVDCVLTAFFYFIFV